MLDDNTKLFTIRNIPIYINVSSVLILAILLVLLITNDLPYFIMYFACLPIILIHEFGHALLSRLFGYPVNYIQINIIKGLCAYESDGNLFNMIIISWGGVLTQLFVLIIYILSFTVFGFPSNKYYNDFAFAFIFINIFTIFYNLLPIGNHDGRTAWKIFPVLYKHFFKKKKNSGMEEKNKSPNE